MTRCYPEYSVQWCQWKLGMRCDPMQGLSSGGVCITSGLFGKGLGGMCRQVRIEHRHPPPHAAASQEQVWRGRGQRLTSVGHAGTAQLARRGREGACTWQLPRASVPCSVSTRHPCSARSVPSSLKNVKNPCPNGSRSWVEVKHIPVEIQITAELLYLQQAWTGFFLACSAA